MKIYWYWPHPHRNASPYVLATRRSTDSVTVHALPSLSGEHFGRVDDYEVVRTLPDPTETGVATSRYIRAVRLARGRQRARAAVLKRGFDVAYLSMLFHHTDWWDVPRIQRGTPVLAHVHDVLPHGYRTPRPVEHAMLSQLYRRTRHLVVYHDVLKHQLIERFGIDQDRVSVVPIPLDARDHRGQFAEPRRPLLLFFGRLRPNKGVKVLVEALELLGDDLDADVVIAGGGNEALTSFVRDRLAAFPNVHLELEHISEERKHELLSRSSWLLLPYANFVAQSAMVTDAYQYRLPVVASNVGALGPTVRAAGAGLLVPPADAHQLAEAIRRASQEDPGPYRLAIAAAAAHHDYAVVGPQLRLILDRVART